MKKFLFLLILLFLNSVVFANENYASKQLIMIDLDEVLDNYSKYDKNNIPPIKSGAKEFVQKLYSEDKYDLILFTTRSPKQATQWLIENKIDKYFKDVTNIKYPAYIYIDDRAIQFNGNYDKTLKQIKKFKVYWKREKTAATGIEPVSAE